MNQIDLTIIDQTVTKPDTDISLSDWIYQQIKYRIIFCYYEPDQYLTETMLAKEYGISKTPIKTAIRTLTKEGWLTAAFRCKTRVSSVTEKDIRSIYEIRLLFEGYAVDQIFQKQLALEYSERLHKKIICAKSYCNDLASFLIYERQIHNVLIEVCQNDRISTVYQNIHDEMMRVSSMYYVMRDDYKTIDYCSEITSWWGEIVFLLKNKNYNEVKSLIASHLRKGQINALNALEKWNKVKNRSL